MGARCRNFGFFYVYVVGHGVSRSRHDRPADPLPHFSLSTAGRPGEKLWSVGEHTDYGLLTILRQDHTGGLQIQSQSKWIDAPIIEDLFICNLDDMPDRMTSGIYRSTPHRVRNSAVTGRLAYPFFFDPNRDAVVNSIAHRIAVTEDSFDRRDCANLHEWTGTNRNYILNKVGKVFPGQRKTIETQEH